MVGTTEGTTRVSGLRPETETETDLADPEIGTPQQKGEPKVATRPELSWEVQGLDETIDPSRLSPGLISTQSRSRFETSEEESYQGEGTILTELSTFDGIGETRTKRIVAFEANVAGKLVILNIEERTVISSIIKTGQEVNFKYTHSKDLEGGMQVYNVISITRKYQKK